MDKNTKPLNVRLKPNEQKSSIKKTTRKASLTKKTSKENKNDSNPKKKKNRKIGWKIFRVFLFVGLAMCIVVAGVVLGVISGIIDDTQSISLDELELLPQTSFLYDMNGNDLASLYDSENRIMVSYDEIPEYTVNAVVAIEDERFFSHHGIDIKRTLGAIGSYIINGGDSDYGASTLTQQLVKNITSDKERAWQRKIREWYRAISLESKLDKSQIFESYVNTIYYGDGSYGIEVASNHFFGKSVSELNLAESAAIAAMIQSPEVTNPYKDDESRARLKERQEIVLNKMLSLGMITAEEAEEAKAYELNYTSKQVSYGGTQSYFVDAVVEAVIEDLMDQRNISRGIALKMIYTDGYKIYTTEDPAVQAAIDSAFDNPNMFYTEWDGTMIQSSMVVFEHSTGAVRGLIGGVGPKEGALTLNRATQSHRQPGSCMKPFGAYGPAFEKGVLSPGGGLDDSPLTIGNWSPHNYYGYFRGFVTARQAIANSMNIPAVRANLKVNDQNFAWQFAYNCGLKNLVESDKNPASLALGGVTYGFSPMEMANAYGTIANGGKYIEPKLYTKVLDRNGNIVLDNEKVETKEVMKESTAYMLTSCLESVVTDPAYGTATGYVSTAGGAIATAGKTGNTNDDYDRWFCGFTPYYTIACWEGYDTNKVIGRAYPYDPIRLFNSVMNQICADKGGAGFPQPASVISTEICRDSGGIATDACKADPRGSRAAVDIVGVDSVPKDGCTVHQFVNVCSVTGKLPGPRCTAVQRSCLVRNDSSNAANTGDAQFLVPTETCDGNHGGGNVGRSNVVIYKNGVRQ